MNLLNISALMMVWLGVASLGFSFQSFHWFELHGLGPYFPDGKNSALPPTIPQPNHTQLQVCAHVGLWGACVVPEVNPLTPSPSPIPGSDGPTCTSFLTTNKFNLTEEAGNTAFEHYLIFPRSFLYLALLFSIFSAIICSLLISGVGSTLLLKDLKHRRYEEPRELLEAALELLNKNDWQHKSYYLTCIIQSLFVSLAISSAWISFNKNNLILSNATVNFFPLEKNSTVIPSNAFLTSILGGIASILSAITWKCSQMVNKQINTERTKEMYSTTNSPKSVNEHNQQTAHHQRLLQPDNNISLFLRESPPRQPLWQPLPQQSLPQQSLPQYIHPQQRQRQQRRRLASSFSSYALRTPGVNRPKAFPWVEMFKLFPLIAIPTAIRTLISSNLPTLLDNYFMKYEHCHAKFPHVNQTSLRFHCANNAGSSYKALFDTMCAVLSFCVTPLIGAFSDKYGRKPLLSFTVIACSVPVISLIIAPTNMFMYLSSNLVPAATGALYGTSPVLTAYVADLVGKRYRTLAMGVLFGFVMVGMSTGPMLEIYIPTEIQSSMFIVYLFLLFLLTIWVQCCMKETNSKIIFSKKMYKAGQRNEQEEVPPPALSTSSSSSDDDDDEMFGKMNQLNPCRSVRLMCTSPLMQVVGIITLFSNISESGVIELFLIYLKDVVNFTSFDNAYLLLVIAIASCYAQTIGMRWFLTFTSETTMILCGLIANAIHLTMYSLIGAAKQKWVALIIATFSAFTFLPLSAFSSMVSKHSDKNDRGLYLGTLISLRALSSVIGPLIFTPLYIVFGSAPYHFPEMPFYVATCLVLTSFCIAWWGLPKVIDSKTLNTARNHRNRERGGGEDSGGGDVNDRENVKLFSYDGVIASDVRSDGPDNGGARSHVYIPPSAIKINDLIASSKHNTSLINNGMSSCTSENLLRLSQVTNESNSGETITEMRMARIERLLSA
jgi:DHA1 family tetracycline resistance protein-like MFS transporter